MMMIRIKHITPACEAGFTLIEMMIVAALLSIMSAMATISIFTAMEEARKKATVAECRQLATAVGFANTDLGFFPKLCFLNFSYDNLMSNITGQKPIPVAQFEYHGHLVNNLTLRLKKNWTKSSPYLTGNSKKIVSMTLPGAVGAPYDWPGDQWGNPYTMYLLKSNGDATTGRITPRFIEKPGEQPDYFAGIVSYGRNAVPGELDSLQSSAASQQADMMTRRLYTGDVKGPFTALQPSQFTDYAKINPILLNIDASGNATTVDPAHPRIREVGSDDILVEF
ncbi:MAG: prepilin-type N-terminal cleavage/methylation domain-containing protein [Candidatus Sumerlaeales bacterium]|nr:prepilin-type N-terminal cleavage/methylation domain-containing protein [Candidatus Sumerlaeales bacterium]